jgi:hypothetical protein
MTATALEVEDLTVHYGGVCAVRSVSFAFCSTSSMLSPSALSRCSAAGIS